MKKRFDKLGKGILVNDFKISTKNKELINKFLKHQQGYIAETRLYKYKYSLYRFADLVEKDFDKLTKEEIREAGSIIINGNLSIKTKQDIIKEIKTAFKFWFGENEYMPKQVIGLKAPKSKQSLRLPTKMPTEKEIYKLIKACKNSRDKLFISIIALDGALRPIECLRMRWGWIKKDKYGYYIVIETAKKSGDKDTRVIRIIKSEPYFIKWNSEYPSEKKDDAYVFINYSNLKPMNTGTYFAMFKRLKKKLGIEERVYAYLYRHALLTKMSKDPNVSPPVLKQFAGHSLKSNTIAEYQHFNDEDIQDMQLKYNGMIKDKGAKKETEKKPIKCPKCNKSNEYDAEFCSYCNMALSQKRRVESNERLNEIENKYQEIIDLLKIRLQLPEGTPLEKSEKLIREKKEVEFISNLKQLKKKYKRK